MRELRQWPSVRSNDSKGIKSFYQFLLKCKVLQRQGSLQYLDSVEGLRAVIAKFPLHVQDSWNKRALSLQAQKGEYVCFKHVLEFIELQSKMANNPNFSRDAIADGKDRRNAVKSFVTSLGAVETPCQYCSRNHALENCASFESLKLSEVLGFIVHKRLCYSCLKPTSNSHYSKICQDAATCRICNKHHPTALHEQHISVNRVVTRSGSVVGLCVVPVELFCEGNPTRSSIVYALLDTGSQGSFISKEVAKIVPGLSYQETTLSVHTLNGAEMLRTEAISGLSVRRVGKIGDGVRVENIKLPVCYTKDELPVSLSEIPIPEAVGRWEHLKRISGELHEVDATIPIGLLIRANCPAAHEPLEVIPSQGRGPYAFKTRLGWCVLGPVESFSHCGSISCNRVRLELGKSAVDSDAIPYLADRSEIKDLSWELQLQSMYNIEFNDLHIERKELSIEDKVFMQKLDASTVLRDGHYEISLPFRNDKVLLPNNRSQALKRCMSVKRKMERDIAFKEKYVEFMTKLFQKGFASEVHNDSLAADVKWYLPHHAVYHPTKGKLRTVFDCAAEFHGKSLNKELLSGPDLTGSLVGVLMRFRQELVAITADIETMFYQVQVPPSQRKFMRFLWWDDGDTTKEVK